MRLLYDAVGSSDIPEESLEELRAAGGKAEAFLPLNPLRKRWSAHLGTTASSSSSTSGSASPAA